MAISLNTLYQDEIVDCKVDTTDSASSPASFLNSFGCNILTSSNGTWLEKISSGLIDIIGNSIASSKSASFNSFETFLTIFLPIKASSVFIGFVISPLIKNILSIQLSFLDNVTIVFPSCITKVFNNDSPTSPIANRNDCIGLNNTPPHSESESAFDIFIGTEYSINIIATNTINIFFNKPLFSKIFIKFKPPDYFMHYSF